MGEDTTAGWRALNEARACGYSQTSQVIKTLRSLSLRKAFVSSEARGPATPGSNPQDRLSLKEPLSDTTAARPERGPRVQLLTNLSDMHA